MIAGPNGSGKTTLTNFLRGKGLDFGRYINADDIAATLTGGYGARVREAQAMADAQRQACLEAGLSFSFETVMSHPSKIELLQRARSAGFTVGVFFIATESAELNVARVEQRVLLGGHDVPERNIRERYIRTLALLPQAMAVADTAALYDNSTELRLFYRRVGAAVEIAPPIPEWAQAAL